MPSGGVSNTCLNYLFELGRVPKKRMEDGGWRAHLFKPPGDSYKDFAPTALES
jgi:hypothetical protein